MMVFFIHSSFNGHLSCFLPIVYSAEITMECRCLFNTLFPFPLNIKSEERFPGWWKGSIFCRLKKHRAILHDSFTKVRSHQHCTSIPFSHQHLLSTVVGAELISGGSFNLNFHDNYYCGTFLPCVHWPFICRASLEKWQPGCVALS